MKSLINNLIYNPYRKIKKDSRIIFHSGILSKSFRVHFFCKESQANLVIDKNCILKNEFIFEGNSGYIRVGKNTFINKDTKIISINEIIIGDNVTISYGCVIYDHDSHSIDYQERRKDILKIIEANDTNNDIQNKNWNSVKTSKVRIGDDAWLGFRVTILKGVTIGNGAIVAANSVVTKDIPPWTIAAGNPARVVKEIPLEMRY